MTEEEMQKKAEEMYRSILARGRDQAIAVLEEKGHELDQFHKDLIEETINSSVTVMNTLLEIAQAQFEEEQKHNQSRIITDR